MAKTKKDDLAELFLLIGNKRLMKDFLEDLFTDTEIKDLFIRWQIVKQLHQGITQREIARNLKVSIRTVTRGAKELRDKQGGFIQLLKLIDKQKVV